MNLRPIAAGISSYLPGPLRLAIGTGGTDSARYCYSVWLRHLVTLNRNGLGTVPRVVAELGPGDSLGIGLAALLSGSEIYFAFDLLEYANVKRNLRIFDELVCMFIRRDAIPDESEFPVVMPRLDSYDFPHHIIGNLQLKQALDLPRLETIRRSIVNPNLAGAMIRYIVPWSDSSVVEPGTVDLIYSQAVLQHVDDLHNTYRCMNIWLKPGGYLSHSIDFKCMGTSNEWNGHWCYSDLLWRLIRGRRPFLINREPRSRHMTLLQEHGFKVVIESSIKLQSNLSITDLAERFRSLSDNDLVTSASFVQAVKQSTVEP